MKMKRILLYTKDIMSLTGRGERSARYAVAAIRKMHGKKCRQPISIQDYCRYAGVSEEEVIKHLSR
jgi:hypothetical protein